MNTQKSFRFETGKGKRTVNIVKIKGKRNQREHLKLAKMRRVCKNAENQIVRKAENQKKWLKNEDNQGKL